PPAPPVTICKDCEKITQPLRHTPMLDPMGDGRIVRGDRAGTAMMQPRKGRNRMTDAEAQPAPESRPVSIPALLARNAARHGAKPAWREKEFGIWQSWTWAEGAAEIRAMAL